MNLEEAIEKINKFKSGTILYGNLSMTKSQYDDVKNAIHTVLQALENSISKDKIQTYINERLDLINKLLEDMIDKSTSCINVSYLSKKEKEELINKRNCLIVQRATLQQVKEELLKGE